MKLTAEEIQQIIQEELKNVLEENVSVESLIPRILGVLKTKKPSSVDKTLTKARVKHLFRYKFRGTEDEREFATKWIDILYRDFPMFKDIVEDDYLLNVSMKPSEFSSSLPDVIDVTDPSYVMDLPDYESGLGVSQQELDRARKEKAKSGEAQSARIKEIEKNKKNMQGANLAGMDFGEANIYYGNFQGANLRGAILSNARLTGGNFESADLRLAKIIKSPTTINQANFNRADLSRSNLRGTRFNGTDFIEAKLNKADLQNCSIGYANFSGADLSQTNLRNCKLYRCDLRGANFKDAILKGTFFDDSEYDDTTIWPDNFKPERRKAIKK